MPSPFPGMDPYIETPEVWPDFHASLANEIRAWLNARVRPRYYASLEATFVYDEISIAESRQGRRDVSVLKPIEQAQNAMASVATAPAPVESRVPLGDPMRLLTVELRTVTEDVLVTSIEILSPVNKRPYHPAYEAYRQKREAILSSRTHLIEIDLLRAGKRPPLLDPVPVAPYYITVNPVERRPVAGVWPVQLRDPLPIIPVPLLPPDPDVPLDLGAVVTSAYERGAYDIRLHYDQPPPLPELSSEEKAWVRERLQAREER